MAKSIIIDIDKFLKFPIGGDLSKVLAYGRKLLRSAESSYAISGNEPEFQKILGEKIRLLRVRLNNIVSRKSMLASPEVHSLRDKVLSNAKAWLVQYSTTTLPIEEKLSKTRKLLEDLKRVAGKYPTREELSTISKLTTLYDKFKATKPQIYKAPGAIESIKDIYLPELPILTDAKRFYDKMVKAVYEDENSLREAIAQAETKLIALRRAFNSLSLNERVKYKYSFTGLMKQIGNLIQKWERQIKGIKEEESKASRIGWILDKKKYEQDKYLENKKKAMEAGQERKLILEVMNSFRDLVKKILSVSSSYRLKIFKDKLPEAIPITQFDELVRKAETLVARVKDKLLGPELEEIEEKLNSLKRERKILVNLYNQLQGVKSREIGEAEKANEGLAYFRANLPSVVKELLTSKEYSEFEELASISINAAKKAIKEATSLAARKNPAKVRKLLKISSAPI